MTDETWYVLLRSGLFEWLRDTHSFDVLDPRCAKCGASWREFMVEPFACDSRLADDVQGQADDVLGCAPGTGPGSGREDDVGVGSRWELV